MKQIKTDRLKDGIKNFVESFRESNEDVTKFGSEKFVDAIVDKDRKHKFDSHKISERKITSKGVM